MFQLTRKRVILGAVGLLVLAGLVYSFIPDPVPVQTAVVSRGPLQVIVEEEGRTEVADRYAITSPVAAYVRRMSLEVGDAVERGQTVAELEPPHTPARDPATRREAAARLRAAEATAARAIAERERVQRLVAADAATRQALEQAVAEAERAIADVEAARAAVQGTVGTGSLPVADVVRSPLSGRVLSVRTRNEGQVNPGDTLIVVGDIDQLEVRTDVLSQDAVRIRPGTRVVLDHWGGGTPLEATVLRVEPQGFTAVSSLGVEEQRVEVVSTLGPGVRTTGETSIETAPETPIETPPETPIETAASRLGAGYRVLARFIVWEGSDVLQVPSSALFRVGDDWAVFVVEGGRAVRRTVSVGHEAGLRTEITDGLTEGEVVIVHPGNELEDGVRVEGD